MPLLLYISYSSGLSEAEKLAINKQVFKNRQAVWMFLKKIPVKSKVIVISTTLVVVIFFSGMDFLRFIGRDEKSHYQRTRILKVIQSLI